MTEQNENERWKRERDHYARAVTDLTERFDEKVEELSLIRTVGDALGTSLDVRTTCARCVDLLQEALAPENCSIMLLDDDGDLILTAARGAFDQEARTYEFLAQPRSFKAGEGLAGQAVSAGRVVRVDDAPQEEAFVVRTDSEVQPRSLLCLPLLVRGSVIGVINLSDSVPGAFELRHERILALIANSVAIGVQNALLFSEVSRSRRASPTRTVLKRQLSDRFSLGELVGGSPRFRAALQLVEKVADTTANVLITGESGTGKDVVARTLHHNSRRRAEPMIAINCAALPESLLEAELFGIERGVATGVDARLGTFEAANGGTLFLDEVGDMSPKVQAGLLRVLQERKVTRVGGRDPIDVDVRLVAATNRSLVRAIEDGRFREDLFYRLKTVTIELPPLRERREDIIPLANHFIARYARHERPDRFLGRAAARALLDHGWPGNVRELEHLMEQSILIADTNEIQPADLGLDLVSHHQVRLDIPDHMAELKVVMSEVELLAERQLIGRALEQTGGNRTRAARLLGISRRSLLYKLGRLELD